MPGCNNYFLYAFIFQKSCLPIFCQSYSIWIGDRCVPAVTKIHSSGIMLTLKSISMDGIIPSPRFLPQHFISKPEDMARSKCLDFNWTQMSVVADYNEDENVTQGVSIYLMKLFDSEKEFDYSRMLTQYRSMCIPSAWEILINGHWIHVKMGFTSGVLNGRTKPISTTVVKPVLPVRDSNKVYRTYRITKMDYCKQVHILDSFYSPPCSLFELPLFSPSHFTNGHIVLCIMA